MFARWDATLRSEVESDLLFGARRIGKALQVPQAIVLRLAKLPGSPFFKSGPRLCVSAKKLRLWVRDDHELFDELNDSLYTVRDIAKFLMTSEGKVNRMIAEQGLPVTRQDGITQASKKTLADWVRAITSLEKVAATSLKSVDDVGCGG